MSAASHSFEPTVHWDHSVLPYFTAAFGSEGLERLSRALCRPPLRNSFRVNLNRCSREDVQKALTGPDELGVAGQSTWSNHAEIPDVLIQQGTGPHTVHYGDTQGKEVIVSRRAAEAVLRGADVFVPGVMACSLDTLQGDLVAVSIAMDVPGSAGHITRGSVIDANLPANSSLYIGKGIVQHSRQSVFKAQSGIGVKMTGRVYDLQPCHGLLPGQGMLQNLPSAVVAHVLSPPPGSRVLDMCASPGGKSTHLAQLMKDQGQVIALDRTHAKAQQIRNLAAELGLSCIQAFKLDATTALQDAPQAAPAPLGNAASHASQSQNSKVAPGTTAVPVDITASQAALQTQISKDASQTAVAPTNNNASEAVLQPQINRKSKLRQERKAKVRAMHGQAPLHQTDPSTQPVCKGFPPESFEYILLDAPCSALGLRPRLTHHTTLSELTQTARYQQKLLQVAVQLLKPGGSLVYSTCTINPGENEGNVQFVLKTFSSMRLVPQQPHLAGPGLTGSYSHDNGFTEDWLTPDQAGFVQRFDPCSQEDTIGFFIAKFIKAA